MTPWRRTTILDNFDGDGRFDLAIPRVETKSVPVLLGAGGCQFAGYGGVVDVIFGA